MPVATPLFSCFIQRLERGPRVLLENLPLTVPHAGILQITGRNGVGKTSLLRFIAKELCANNIKSLFIPSSTSYLKPQESIIETLSFWAEDAQKIPHALSVFGLAGMAQQKIFPLSAGQRQRVSLARLLLTDAPVWLIDEPLNSLDDAAQNIFAALLKDHATKGGGAVVASHLPILDAAQLSLDAFAAESAAA